MVAAGTDQQGDEVSGAHRELVDRFDPGGLTAIDLPGSQPPALGVPAQLQGPGQSVAAFGMGVDDAGLEAHQARSSDSASRPRRSASARDAWPRCAAS